MNQRKIKFRAWDNKKKKMSRIITLREAIKTDGEDLLFKTNINDLEFLQFTGLHDKNGKEIYEGDIVEHKSEFEHVAGKFKVEYNNRFKVEYEKGEFAAFCLIRIGNWTPRYEGDTGWEGVVGSQGHLAKELKVIGNIMENPGLLK